MWRGDCDALIHRGALTLLVNVKQRKCHQKSVSTLYDTHPPKKVMFKRRKKIAYLGSTFGSAFHVWRMSLLYIISFLLLLKNCRNQKLNTLVQGGARNSLKIGDYEKYSFESWFRKKGFCSFFFRISVRRGFLIWKNIAINKCFFLISVCLIT